MDEVLRKEETFETSTDSPVAETQILYSEDLLPLLEVAIDKAAYSSPFVPSEVPVSCPELDINVRNGGTAPQEDYADYNFQFPTDSTQKRTVALIDLPRQLDFLSQQVNRKPEQHYIPGRVVFGSEKACRSLLDADVLPSNTQGVILTESLRPSVTGQFRDTVEFKTTEEIGCGSCATVHLCIDETSKKEFVLKRITKVLKKSEVEILLKLQNKNISRLFGVITRDGQPEILMENCGQSLRQFALHEDTKGLLTQDKIFDFNRQGLQGLQYLAIHDIIHFDIKPENICIQENTVKITDFGSACSPQDQITFDGWTPEYMSPEACRMVLSSRIPITQLSRLPPVEGDNSVTTQTDLFAWAVTVQEGTCSHSSDDEWPDNIQECGPGRDWKNQVEHRFLTKNPNIVKQSQIPDNCSPDMKKLLEEMLEGRPDLRITPSRALKRIEEMDVQAIRVNEGSVSLVPSDESLMSSASESSMDVKHYTKPLQQRGRLRSI